MRGNKMKLPSQTYFSAVELQWAFEQRAQDGWTEQELEDMRHDFERHVHTANKAAVASEVAEYIAKNGTETTLYPALFRQVRDMALQEISNNVDDLITPEPIQPKAPNALTSRARSRKAA